MGEPEMSPPGLTSPRIRLKRDGDFEMSWDRGCVCFPQDLAVGHLGTALLGKLRTRKEDRLPQTQVKAWDGRYGKLWRSKDDVCGKVADAILDALHLARMDVALLIDCMRRSSDYWRPGSLLLRVAERVRGKGKDVVYARSDLVCPPGSLLEAFRQDTSMGFGEYAERYAEYLGRSGGLRVAVEMVGMACAQGRLPLFYCIDPTIPGYARAEEFMSGIPYSERTYLDVPELREDGCHRYIVVEQVVRSLVCLGGAPRVLECLPTFGKAVWRWPR